MENVIRSFINDRLEEIGELEESEQIAGIVEEVKEKFQTQCKYIHAGGYDSPGYDMDAYVIVFIDETEEIQGVDVTIESC